MRNCRVAVCAALAAILWPLPTAGGPCLTLKTVLQQLRQRHGEEVVWTGVDNHGQLVQVLGAADRGSWTVIVTSPRGCAKVIGAGHGWQAMTIEVEEGHPT